MSINAIIAREVDAKLGKFEGRYHHWDGYPTGLGKTLHELYAYVFLKDKPAMIILNGYGNIWKFIAEVDLEKEKIDWEKIENEAN